MCEIPKPDVAIDVIIDTDANNELDDQFALAYLMFSDRDFNIVGITTNATISGGDIDQHTREAANIITLCNKTGVVELVSGVNGSFEDVKETIENPEHDGYKAVDFIIEKARQYSPQQKITLLAIGKLTNVALALQKEPEIADNIRLVWLGANYPEQGEYNLENDIPSMNFLLDNTNISFEMATVRYNRSCKTYKRDGSCDTSRLRS